MKILHVIASISPNSGGTAEAIKQISQGLIALGHGTEVACLDDPDSPWLREFPFKVFALGPSMTGYQYSNKLVPWLRQKTSTYDCVIVHGIWQYHSFGVWRALHRSKIPYYVYPHGMLDPWFKHTYPLKHLKKWLYWPWADYRVLRDAKAVLFTCEEEQRLARQSFWLYKCHGRVINMGIALPPGDSTALRQNFLNQFPELEAKHLLLFLGRIHVKKGCDLLIQAFTKVAQTDQLLHLAIAGPDQVGWQAALQNQADRLGISQQISWTGLLQGDLKWGALYAAEALVLPSHQENFGIVVAESMACGVPVLISNKVNIWREIIADKAGVVGQDNLEGTVEVLQKWLSTPIHQRRSMQENAKNSFEKRFSIHQSTQNLIRLLSEK